MFVPLLIGDRAIGLISLQNLDREHAFNDGDVRLLMTIGSSLSVALENARLFDETRRRAAELSIVNTVGQAFADQLDLDALIEGSATNCAMSSRRTSSTSRCTTRRPT